MAVMICPSCSHSFEAVFCEPLGKEGKALRAELARLVKEVVEVESATDEAAMRAAQREANVRSDSAVMIAAVQGEYAHCRDPLEEARAKILDLKRRIAEYRGGHNPVDTAIIAALKAKADAADKRIAYYENPNSRQGMPSLRKGQAKKLDKEIEESCRRNGGTGAPIGPPMGHKGCSHHVKADRAHSGLWQTTRGPRATRAQLTLET